MLVASSLDDIVQSKAVTGLDVNWLRGSLVAAGLDPERLHEEPSLEEARNRYGKGNTTGAPERWSAIWSAGHSVSGITAVPGVADVVRRMHHEFHLEPATADLAT